MGINSTATAYNFGQLGSAHMHNDNGETLSPPDGMVIVAITMLGNTKFDVLTPDTANSVVYSGTESNDVYFGIGTTANENGNSEQVDNNIIFPEGMTIYGRWTAVSLNDADTDGGIICYFGL
jgi:hypothetical protein